VNSSNQHSQPQLMLPAPAVTIGAVDVYQLLSGRDFAKEEAASGSKNTTNMIATQMANYSYMLVDRSDASRQHAVLVDPCYDIAGLAALARQACGGGGAAETCGVVTSALFTHHHPDHVGGRFGKYNIEGLKEVAALPGQPFLYIHTADLEQAAKQCGISPPPPLTPTTNTDEACDAWRPSRE
jgi:glyoxylase-like metal-dependent hydrolase (beta-lactamase superfamily II)